MRRLKVRDGLDSYRVLLSESDFIQKAHLVGSQLAVTRLVCVKFACRLADVEQDID